MSRLTSALAVAGAAGGAYLGARAVMSPQARFARMTGSSIAAPDAAAWVTDFLNAAYYRRPPELRDVDDLRLAFAILTTRWHRRGHRRLRAADVLPSTAPSAASGLWTTSAPRGTLNREQLLHRRRAAARRLVPRGLRRRRATRLGHRVRVGAEREAYRPRSACATRGSARSTPGTPPGAEQTWHTYPPVEVPSADAVIAALSRTGDLARLRERGRALHAGAAGRSRRADVRDRGRRRHGRRRARVHARLRNDHAACEPRGPGALRALRRRAQRRAGALRPRRAPARCRPMRRRSSPSI